MGGKASVSQIFTRFVKLDASEMRLSFRMAARRHSLHSIAESEGHTHNVFFTHELHRKSLASTKPKASKQTNKQKITG